MSEVLEKITSTATAFLRLLSDPAPKPDLVTSPDGRGGSVVIVRDDYKVEQIAGPERAKRTHVFHDLGSFAEWLKRWANPATAEILVGDAKARALLGGETVALDPASDVTCLLRHHPTFAAWKAAFGVKLNPKAFHAFIRSVAVTFGNGGGVTAADVLSAELAKLKAVKNGEINMSVDPRGFYAVSGATTAVQVDAKIPPSFTIRTPILIGIPESESSESEMLYLLEILLSMDVEDSGIFFTLTCPTLDAVLHQARLDAVGYLRTLLGEGFLVGLGDIATTPVAG